MTYTPRQLNFYHLASTPCREPEPMPEDLELEFEEARNHEEMIEDMVITKEEWDELSLEQKFKAWMNPTIKGKIKEEWITRSVRKGLNRLDTEMKKRAVGTNSSAPAKDYQKLINASDFHCWVENANGKVVFDPDFPEYQMIRNIRGCTKEQHHKGFPMKYQKILWNKKKKEIKTNMKLHSRFGVNRDITPCLKMFGLEPRYAYCHYNASGYVANHRGEGLKIVIGSMGWTQKSGGVFWEFG